MTKIEIDALNGGLISKSDGVHLLREEISGQPFYQLVLGASDINGGLKQVVDRVFWGYTIGVQPPEKDSCKYKAAMIASLKRDNAAVQAHIIDMITDNNLDGYSFYFYVLPFNIVLNEKERIIKDILNGGVLSDEETKECLAGRGTILWNRKG